MSIAMSDDGRQTGPPRFTPSEAVERFLNTKATSLRDSTLQTYYNRLDLFIWWCERRGIDTIDELDGWELDEYRSHRAGIVAPVTLREEMKTLRLLFRELERIEVVEDGLAERIHVPAVSDEETTDPTHLAESDALALLEYFRTTDALNGTRRHVVLELAWNIGARRGGLRALDLRDVHTDEDFVEFHHREGTPLKNGAGHHPRGGERFVGITPAVSAVLERYIDRHRPDAHDDQGRAPLLSTKNGRMHISNVQGVAYHSTLPCIHGPCPHDRDPDSCKWTYQSYAYGCPSSRSPHQIRTGSIMWQRDRGLPAPVVAERVNASVETIEQYYDHQLSRERLERRRRDYVELLDDDPERDDT